MGIDTLIRLFERLSSSFSRPWEVLIELLLIGLSVNWCAGVLHGTRGTRLLRGLLIMLIAVTLIVRVLAAQLGWTRLELLYQYFIIGLAFIALVAFQPELRRALIRAGEVPWLRRGRPADRLIAALVESAAHLARNRHGALIAVQRGVGLANWAEHGTQINATVSANLLNSLFFPNSPLHDLGVVVRGHTILAAGCQFPMAESGDIDPSLGSRHRAAVGLSQESDALVLVVSEETGIISLADRGQLVRRLSVAELETELTQRLDVEGSRAIAPARRRGWTDVKRSIRRLALVAPLAMVIWFLADQASLVTREGVTIELNVVHDALTDVQFSTPPVYSLTVTGATRDVEALRAQSLHGAIRADWMLAPPYTRAGRYALAGDELAAFFGGLGVLRGRGVVVSRVAPEALSFAVDEVVTIALPVQAVGGQRRLTDVQVDPSEVTVWLRKGDLAAIAQADQFARAQVGEAFAAAPPEELTTVERVPLEPRVGGFRVLRSEPSAVKVTARVAADTVRSRLRGVPVQIAASLQFLQKYSVVPRDEGEWLTEIEVEGDRALIEKLRPQDVSAWVPLTSELPSPEFHTAEVVVTLPPSVRLVGRPRQVQYKLIAREAGAP